MSQSTLIRHKRGDTFTATVTYRDSTGTLVDLAGYTVRCQVKNGSGVLIEALTVTHVSTGVVTISATAAQTALWPIATLKADIEYASAGGVVQSTDTFHLAVSEDITL